MRNLFLAMVLIFLSFWKYGNDENSHPKKSHAFLVIISGIMSGLVLKVAYQLLQDHYYTDVNMMQWCIQSPGISTAALATIRKENHKSFLKSFKEYYK